MFGLSCDLSTVRLLSSGHSCILSHYVNLQLTDIIPVRNVIEQPSELQVCESGGG